MTVDPTLIARLREAAEDFPPHPDDELLPAQRLMGHVLAYGRLRHLAAAHVDDHPGESEAYGLAAAMLLEHIAALVAETLPERVTQPTEPLGDSPTHIRQVGSSHLNFCMVRGGEATWPDAATCPECKTGWEQATQETGGEQA